MQCKHNATAVHCNGKRRNATQQDANQYNAQCSMGQPRSTQITSHQLSLPPLASLNLVLLVPALALLLVVVLALLVRVCIAGPSRVVAAG